MAKKEKKTLTSAQCEALFEALQTRFTSNVKRHTGIAWADVQAKLESAAEKLWSLNEMERSGGEPDVVGLDSSTGEYIFFDCSKESPAGRRSLCYDRDARVSRKEHAPESSAMEMAEAMGIDILNEEEYKRLQTLGHFDAKTSSWLRTPRDIRDLGGAIFGDYRYDHVFTYHNGVQSYYAARGFRGSLRL